MKKIYSFILLFPLLLVSCGEGSINPSTSPSEEEGYKLIVNCPGHEDESYENKSGDDLNPSHPSIKNYYFDGWYDQKDGGELVDFSNYNGSAYGHWTSNKDMTDAQKLDRFIKDLTMMSGTVNHTFGDQSISVQYSVSDKVYTGTSSFLADRYDNLVVTKTYSPYYAVADEVVKEEDKGKTADEVNEANYFNRVDDYWEDGMYFNVYQYNQKHSGYNSIDYPDGYYVQQDITQNKANQLMSIDFSSYFLGVPSTLLANMNAGHKFTKIDNIEDDNIEVDGDFYYMDGFDSTVIDPWDTKTAGASFGLAFTVSNTTTSGYLVTNAYTTEASVAFRNGKIAYCRVFKSQIYYINRDAQMAVTTESNYEFTQGDITREFDGDRLDYQDFQEYEDTNSN